jgi:protein-disulfide isomerase
MSILTPPLDPAKDHIKGNLDAPAELVEFGDFECPFCSRAHAGVQLVLAKMDGSVRFAFRHFPLAQAHPHALLAAEAAEAAGAQGSFWRMHDILFEHQDALDFQDLVDYAAALNLDVARFIRDLQRHTYLQKVRDDFKSGVRSGVNGTPTFFIDGERHDANWGPEALLAALRSRLVSQRENAPHQGLFQQR